MRVSVAISLAATLLSSFLQVQAKPIIETSPAELVQGTVAKSIQPTYELAIRSTTELELSSWSLFKRASSRWSKGRISCPGPFVHAKSSGFRKAVKALRKRKGRPSLAAKGKYATCQDLCFKDGTQISWCNKDNKKKTLQSWKSVAEGIEVLLKQSKCTAKKNDVQMTGGAIYHPTNWYVFAGKCKP